MSSDLLTADGASIHAVLVGDRIDTAGLERSDVLSTAPLAFRHGAHGVVMVFRYGVVVTLGLAALEQDAVLHDLAPRISGPFHEREEERLAVERSPGREDHIPPGGPVHVAALPIERLLVIADALAKSVVLARDEREVAAVFDTIEPFARHLAEHGRTLGGRRDILKHIGNALLVQHRVSGRVAVAEKPDVLWDRPDLERLYARVEDEYELTERAEALNRKLSVVAETAIALTDIIDTNRSLRLELIIVVLIAVEILIAGYEILSGYGVH